MNLKRFLSVFRKTMLEQLRSIWDLLLVLILVPGFIFMYWSFMGGGSTSYKLLVVNQDSGICQAGGSNSSCAEQVIDAMRQLQYASGAEMLKIEYQSSRDEAEAILRNRGAAALMIFPPDFTTSLNRLEKPSTVTFVGDLTNPYYSVAAIFANAALDDYTRLVANQPRPVLIAEEMLGHSGGRTEFELYVPGLLIAAVTMIIFSVSIAVAREVESGALRRLQLTHVSSFELLGGISLVYILLGLLSIVLSFLTACALGFRSQGPMWVAVLINVLTAVASIGVGIMTACFSRTVARAAIIANFPLLIMLFFSGAVFPMPQFTLFTIGGRAIRLFDLIPQTHAVLALNKILSLGAGFGDVVYEIAALLILAAIYFLFGGWLFKKIQMQS
jgi:ABC-2 type transport system permease protein